MVFKSLQNQVTDVENELMLPEGKGEGGLNRRVGRTLYIKQITNKDLLYSTGDSTQYSVMIYMGKRMYKRGGVCVRMADSLCYTAKTNTTV